MDANREDANILSCIPSTNIFIEAGIEAGGVLVHCFGGRSRSAAFIAAYLMCNCGWTYDKVISMIVAARPVASVNKGFEKQLRAYALTNYDVYATQQVLLRNRIKALHAIRGQNSVNSKCHDRIDGSWKENAKGGNKRLWGDRDSRGAGGIISMLQQEKDRRAEEGVEDEKQDSDREDSFEESNNRQGNRTDHVSQYCDNSHVYQEYKYVCVIINISSSISLILLIISKCSFYLLFLFSS